MMLEIGARSRRAEKMRRGPARRQDHALERFATLDYTPVVPRSSRLFPKVGDCGSVQCGDYPAAKFEAPDLTGVEPAKVTTTAVVGMGSMGTGIAHALIIAGFPVVVRDENISALEKGLAKITKSIQKQKMM